MACFGEMGFKPVCAHGVPTGDSLAYIALFCGQLGYHLCPNRPRSSPHDQIVKSDGTGAAAAVVEPPKLPL